MQQLCQHMDISFGPSVSSPRAVASAIHFKTVASSFFRLCSVYSTCVADRDGWWCGFSPLCYHSISE